MGLLMPPLQLPPGGGGAPSWVWHRCARCTLRACRPCEALAQPGLSTQRRWCGLSVYRPAVVVHTCLALMNISYVLSAYRAASRGMK